MSHCIDKTTLTSCNERVIFETIFNRLQVQNILVIHWQAKSVARHWSPAAPGVIAIAPMSIKVWVAQIINWLSGLKQHEYFSESSSMSSYELSILSQIVCKVTPNVVDLVFSVVIDDSTESNLDVKSLT